jgi:hypothetical protein
VICLLALATLVAGCTSTTNGTAAPAPAAATTSGGGDASTPPSVNNYVAPKVATPLDTTKWQPNPCTTVTAAQLQALDITQPGKLTTDPTGNLCDWSPQLDVHYTFAFNTSFDPGDAKGLANDYEFADGSLARLPDIQGQPAVTQPAKNTDGNCTVYVGATDTVDYVVAVVIEAGLPHHDDPCTPAHQIAADATATMKAG